MRWAELLFRAVSRAGKWKVLEYRKYEQLNYKSITSLLLPSFLATKLPTLGVSCSGAGRSDEMCHLFDGACAYQFCHPNCPHQRIHIHPKESGPRSPSMNQGWPFRSTWKERRIASHMAWGMEPSKLCSLHDCGMDKDT